VLSKSGDQVYNTEIVIDVLCTHSQSPAPLSTEEKAAFIKTLKGISVSSDAFFPFRDNIDQCARRGV